MQHPAPRHEFVEPVVDTSEVSLELVEHQRVPLRDLLATIAAVSAGAMFGANTRYLVNKWVTTHWGGPFPWGTFVINVTGSLILGIFLTLVTVRFSGRTLTRLFVATGFLGAYTTFSTFSYDTTQLIQRGHTIQALLYVAASLVLGLSASIAGIGIANALTRE
jgi:CrcB protein